MLFPENLHIEVFIGLDKSWFFDAKNPIDFGLFKAFLLVQGLTVFHVGMWFRDQHGEKETVKQKTLCYVCLVDHQILVVVLI